MDFADSIIAVEDAIGADYIELAPPGEAHLDPVTVGTLLASYILYAVGAGIKDGLQEAVKDGTAAILRACAHQVSERLLPERLREFFTRQNSQGEQAAARQQAGQALADAAAAASELDAATAGQLATTVATAVADAVHAAGLKNTGTQRLAQTVEAQVKITFTSAT